MRLSEWQMFNTTEVNKSGTVIAVIQAPQKNKYHCDWRIHKGRKITLPLGVAPELRWRLIIASKSRRVSAASKWLPVLLTLEFLLEVL